MYEYVLNDISKQEYLGRPVLQKCQCYAHYTYIVRYKPRNCSTYMLTTVYISCINLGVPTFVQISFMRILYNFPMLLRIRLKFNVLTFPVNIFTVIWKILGDTYSLYYVGPWKSMAFFKWVDGLDRNNLTATWFNIFPIQEKAMII